MALSPERGPCLLTSNRLLPLATRAPWSGTLLSFQASWRHSVLTVWRERPRFQLLSALDKPPPAGRSSCTGTRRPSWAAKGPAFRALCLRKRAQEREGRSWSRGQFVGPNSGRSEVKGHWSQHMTGDGSDKVCGVSRTAAGEVVPGLRDAGRTRLWVVAAVSGSSAQPGCL